MTAFGMADCSEWRPFGMAGRHRETLPHDRYLDALQNPCSPTKI